MQIVSVNVGLPRSVVWKGREVTTGIFKEPVAGRVMVRRLNVDGDQQADLSVHGGVSKAVYAYGAQHYPYWREQLPDAELSWGAFGENLTLSELDEETINIGDRFRIGAIELIATEPRVPCYKLGIRFGRADMVKRFLHSGRSGVYFAVLHEGEVGAGDAVEVVSRDEHGVTVADVARLYRDKQPDRAMLQRAVQVEALSPVWRGYFMQLLEKAAN
jgi:MOSC domain-containing protein YiiM